jgi:hypothetical protein
MRPDPRRLTCFLLGAVLATTVLAIPVAAQEKTEPPVPAACDILSADEVSGAFGETLTLQEGSGATCQFDADYEGGRFLSLFTDVQESTSLSDIREFLCTSMVSPAPGGSPAPGCVDLTVGGAPALYLPDSFGTLAYVDLGGGNLFSIQLVGEPAEGVDARAALVAVAELALPRVAAIPLPTALPEPSFVRDTALEALFPTEIGGIAVEVQSMSGQDVAAQAGDVPQRFIDALAAQGKTLADVSVAFGTAFDPDDGSYAAINALQVHGADVSTILEAFVAVINGDDSPMEQTQVEIAGKQVTAVRPAESEPGDDVDTQHVYASGDVLWVVTATEPDLTEVFQKLP